MENWMMMMMMMMTMMMMMMMMFKQPEMLLLVIVKESGEIKAGLQSPPAFCYHSYTKSLTH